MDASAESLTFGRIAATLPVKDIGRAHDFYCGLLGFNKLFENGDPVGFMILKRDAAEIHLTLQRDHKAAKFPVAHMIVDDADALHGVCVENGLRIIKRLGNADYGLRGFVFEDTEGNRIDVGQPI